MFLKLQVNKNVQLLSRITSSKPSVELLTLFEYHNLYSPFAYGGQSLAKHSWLVYTTHLHMEAKDRFGQMLWLAKKVIALYCGFPDHLQEGWRESVCLSNVARSKGRLRQYHLTKVLYAGEQSAL